MLYTFVLHERRSGLGQLHTVLFINIFSNGSSGVIPKHPNQHNLSNTYPQSTPQIVNCYKVPTTKLHGLFCFQKYTSQTLVWAPGRRNSGLYHFYQSGIQLSEDRVLPLQLSLSQCHGERCLCMQGPMKKTKSSMEDCTVSRSPTPGILLQNSFLAEPQFMPQMLRRNLSNLQKE